MDNWQHQAAQDAVEEQMEQDELRDKLARLCGWEPARVPPGAWEKDIDTPAIWVCGNHPFPDGDLTALAAAWPEGVSISIHSDSLSGAWSANCRGGQTDQHPTEYAARLALTVAVLEQEQRDG